MSEKNKKFALIWWIKSAQKDIISLCSIPKCKQKVNCIVNLTWQDFKTKEKIKAIAKILAISDDEKKLHRTMVTKNGELHDATEKIFSSPVLNEKKSMAENQKLIKNIKRSNEKIFEEKIKKTQHIFYKQNRMPLKSIPHKNETLPTTSSNRKISKISSHNQQPYIQEKYCSKINNKMKSIPSTSYSSETIYDTSHTQHASINSKENVPSSKNYISSCTETNCQECTFDTINDMKLSSKTLNSQAPIYDGLYNTIIISDENNTIPVDNTQPLLYTVSNQEMSSNTCNDVYIMDVESAPLTSCNSHTDNAITDLKNDNTVPSTMNSEPSNTSDTQNLSTIFSWKS